ncbi:MAG: dockerin type I domain-containing protein [Chloroflexia bacterium]
MPVTLTLKSATTETNYPVQNTDSSGFFTYTITGLPDGLYTWRVRGPQYLAASGTTNLGGSSVVRVEMGLLRGGDCNGDNIITVGDVTILKSTYGKSSGQPGYDPRADFNGDDRVDAGDLAVQGVNFGRAGSPPPGPVSGPCPIFPANNYWHKDISLAPVHTLSDQYITALGPTYFLHPGFASGTWQGETIGLKITHNYSPTPVPINFTQYPRNSDPGPYPVPTNAAIQGGPNSTGDRHVVVVDEVNCVEYDMYHSYPNTDGSWNAGSGAKWNLGSNALRPYGWTSSDAAGLPLAPALITYQEVADGAINHAMRFTAMNIQYQNIAWPARHTDGQSTDPNAPPMGTRLRLKANYDISQFSPTVQTILRALKKYGMVLADSDQSNQFDIGGEPDSRWNDANLVSSLQTIHGSDFEVVDMSGYMVDPNSGETR